MCARRGGGSWVLGVAISGFENLWLTCNQPLSIRYFEEVMRIIDEERDSGLTGIKDPDIVTICRPITSSENVQPRSHRCSGMCPQRR